MEQLLQSLNVMLLGMCGIFIVMSVLSLATVSYTHLTLPTKLEV